MTHFTVGIIIPKSVSLANLPAYVHDAMAPYDENEEVESYVSYSVEDAADDLAKAIERYEAILSRKEGGFDPVPCREHLARLRQMTPEDKYRDYVEYHKEFNEAGEPVSRYNPDSKWDWYVIGGRWDGWVHDRETSREAIEDNMATTAEVLQRNKIPHSLITPDGAWHEAGTMGWFGVMITEHPGYETESRALLARYPDCNVLILDAHI